LRKVIESRNYLDIRVFTEEEITELFMLLQPVASRAHFKADKISLKRRGKSIRHHVKFKSHYKLSRKI